MSSKPNLKNDAWFKNLVRTKYLKVSKLGIVTNLSTGRNIGSVGSGGYYKISVKDSKADKIKSMQVHRLVWLTHIGPIPKNIVVNHKDGNKLNNKLNNLELTTVLENNLHAIKTGLHLPLKGGAKPNATFTDKEVAVLRKKFSDADGRLKARSGALKFGVATITFSSMLKGKTYGHVVTGYEKECARILIINSSGSSRPACPKLVFNIKRLRLQGLSSYKISATLGIARNTVMKYWNL